MKRTLGFWRSWALVVGTMVGSGVFMLPATLAPYGSNSIKGWLFAGVGTLFIALSLSALARKHPKLGGPYAYTRIAFGDFAGFLMAWGYWISLWSGVSAVAIAFAGYASSLFGGELTTIGQLAIAIGVILVFAAVNLRGIEEASIVQLATTVLKLLPLVAVGAVGFFVGDWSSVEATNPEGLSETGLISAMALLIMWAFIGVESATIPADSVENPEKTIPRALVLGALSATAVYVVATYGVMLLLPADELVSSTAPFSDAAVTLFGPTGQWIIGIGALIAIAGTLNSLLMFSGQLPRALAEDRLFPAFFAKVSNSGAPAAALILSTLLAILFVIFNYSENLVTMFEWIIQLSTLMVIAPYAACAAADLWLQRKDGFNAFNFAIAMLALAYAVFIIYGTGWETLLYGLGLLFAGVPIYTWMRLTRQN